MYLYNYIYIYNYIYVLIYYIIYIYIYTFKTHKLSRQRASNVINSTFPALTTQHSQL